MNIVKYELLLKEFPFLSQIMRELCANADGIERITVRRADVNVLEVKPFYYSEEYDGGNIVNARLFWKVASDGVSKKLFRSIDAVTATGKATTTHVQPIGCQLRLYYSGRDVAFLVECRQSETVHPELIIYKMNKLDWEQVVAQRWPTRGPEAPKPAWTHD